MINLLPQQEKQALVLDRNKRLVLVFGSVLIISLLVLGLVLFAVKFYILENINYHESLLESMKKNYETPDFLAYKGIIQKYNTVITNVDSFYAKEASFASVLKMLAELQRPEGLYFTSLNVERVPAERKMKVLVGGFSNTRDNLLLFKDVVEKHEKIKNVYFPPINWIKSSNISFSLTFEIHEK